ncbi:MAG TPA: hypothetical protein VGW75_06575 [Solirubrobacteraceae bacterium]|nr:hypothetical protein [Solirubrobacteraceae bacterium]
MRPRDAARALALGRIAIGAACAVAPRTAGALWIGADARRPGTTVFARALGARDVLLGAMVLHTVDHPEVAPRWLAATAACDAVDCASALAVRDDLPPARGAFGIALAGGAAVAGLALSRAAAARGSAS